MRKENSVFHFSVEGETEKWYLEWLRDQINACSEAERLIKLDCKVQKDPIARIKSTPVLYKTEFTHIFDREGDDEECSRRFEATLGRMKQAQDIGKKVKYKLGYSNFTFELWIILHKADCFGTVPNRSRYLEPLNRAYGENFESLPQYKEESNFKKRILAKLTLNDAKDAIQRAKAIEEARADGGCQVISCAGYSYYRENPSLSIWQVVEKMLKESKIV